MQTETANALLASPHFQLKGGVDHLLVADSYKLWDMERNSDFSLEFLQVQPALLSVRYSMLFFQRDSLLLVRC